MTPQPPALGHAAFSRCGHYRWWLERVWDPQRPRLIFIGLNPSQADGQRDDPTLRRLRGFADRWGYGALEVLNLFARISASPVALRRVADPIGSQADRWLLQRLAAHPAAPLWLGWGNQGCWRQRDQRVLTLLHQPPRLLLAVGFTATGQPRHPLYVPNAAKPLQLQHAEGASLRPSGPL